MPDESTFYTLTINLSKGDATRWKPYEFHLAVFDRSTLSEEPVRIIDGTKEGNNLVFRSVPSASKEHLDLFGIGSAPDYGRNNYLALYTNDTLVKQHEWAQLIEADSDEKIQNSVEVFSVTLFH